MENNKSKGILVSDTQLTDIIDKYDFLLYFVYIVLSIKAIF